MTTKDKMKILETLKANNITSSKQFSAMSARDITKIVKTMSQMTALLDLQDAVKADKSPLFDYLMTDDKEIVEEA